MRGVYLLILILSALVCSAAPEILSFSGNVSNGKNVTFVGENFGVKALAPPVVWDNLEDGTCNTDATIGTWTNTNDLGISSNNQRHAFSTYNGMINFVAESTAGFRGGSDSSNWFIQYWFYLGSDWNWGAGDESLGNLKILRLWSTRGTSSVNLHVQIPINHVDVVVEGADVAHGGWGTG